MRWMYLIMFLAAACGGHDATPPDAGSPPDAGAPVTTVASFCADFSARICDGLSSCGCRFDVRPYDADGCAAARTDDCIASFGGAVGADLDAGRAVFDEDAVAACLAATEAMAAACTLEALGPAAPLPDACLATVVASAALDEPCELSSGGLAFCAGGDGVCIPGDAITVCTALPGDGDLCPQGLCGGGLACNGDRCAAPGGDGDACAAPTACGDGLVCAPDGRCASPLAADAICTETSQCAAGLACDQGQCSAIAALGDGCSSPAACGAERSCGRAPETRTCTDPDLVDQPCENWTCAAGLACASSTQTCVALPGDTEACLDGFACADGLTCIDGLGTCAPLPGLGETCASGNRFCQTGLGCRQSDNTCQPGGADGEECLLNPPDHVCVDGLGCDFGDTGSVCAPITGAGSACHTDRTCADGTYCEFSTLLCATDLADGAPCEDGNECADGSACTVLPAGPTCAPIPDRDEPCIDVCTTGLACKGPGGVCVPALCTIPG